MIGKIIIYTVVISFNILFSALSNARSLHLDTYSTEQGLTQNSITCAINDKRGFHWFSTQGGLNRFDGYNIKRFKSYPMDPLSLSGNWITACGHTENGTLWITTATKGLNLLDTETGQFSHINQTTELAIKDDRIWSATMDSKNTLWMGHEDGNLTQLNIKHKTANFFSYTHPDASNVIFRDVITDNNNNIWIASNVGLIKFDKQTTQFVYYPKSMQSLWRLKTMPNGALLIASKNGLSTFNPKTEVFKDLAQLKGIWITDIMFDNEQNLWLSSYGKGLFYQPYSNNVGNHFEQYRHTAKQQNGLASDYLLTLYQDPQNIIWIGTDGYGIQRYDASQKQFNHQQHQESVNSSISHNFVRALLKDSQGRLWVGTRSGLNKQTKRGFIRYTKDDNEPTSLTNNNIFSLFEDANQRVWIGTYGGGLLRYDPQTDSFVAFTKQSHQLSSNNIYAITGDAEGNLWLGGNQGLTRFNPDTLAVKHFQHDKSANSLSNNTIFTLLYDKYANAIWAGTRVGLNKLQLTNEQFTHYKANSNNATSLSHNMVTSMHLENEQTLWVGTMGGINRLNKKTGVSSSISEQNGLLNDNIFAVKQDKQGRLWLSSNQGLTRYDPKTEQMQHYLPRDGIQHNSFILGAAFQGDDGELLFGGINGFNQFYPHELAHTKATPEPVLTELLINNQASHIKSYASEDKTKLISYATNLTFDKAVGVIGFTFSALNSNSSPDLYQYAYKLVGLDKQFLFTDAKQRYINYSQLPAGSYQLQLKVKDQHGKWSKPSELINLTIVPPWWQTTFAYIIYISLSILIIWLITYSMYRAKIAEQKNKQAQELNKLKSEFLDNISHELKTPLSLIIAPLEYLQAHFKEAAAQVHLSTIKRNSQYLLTLINQLLQLSQRPSAALNTVSPYSISTIFEQLVEDFNMLFVKKQITFSIKKQTPNDLYINVEPQHTLSIISNLLSNALKYTPSHGSVTITLSENNKMAQISVQDTGIGIEKHQQEAIFERFNRVNSDNNGCGIGLALVKQLTQQYNGSISLESEKGKGSCFKVCLPLVQAMSPISLPTEEQASVNNSSQHKKILIVEDNEDMQQLLVSLFSPNYICISAQNGEQGVLMCKSEMPDLVISDVMMPIMDGYELLNTLRTNIATSHIPVLLLSAKADTQSRLKGLDLLADDFLSKPFEPKLLLGRVQGLLNIREVLNRHLSLQLSSHEVAGTSDSSFIQNKDYSFTERLKNIVHKHYQQESFTVEQLAEHMHISPRALQLKMKAIFNLTPTDYIRNIRLVQAEKLLLETDLAVGLIADKVGFSSQSYFARCFKTKHQLTPKQFRDNNKKLAKISPM
ncbi:two-component regulator propeller domain-containing protein [Pseudoalteromonas sp. 1_MG-2023]|uniref:hybrid sensor histidine kinase/response regulator transcription factor n=1 Tax=Pseudoalteromonas sp. 1_MG-2023 TaxID=3062617 RepID=UPI002736DFCF|nr:two-component regulator propeller domain-containing protein [Pseudoalteromonas sp. 1_MG-2023]MDP2634118.1 two-component regulator propeller domain-containing protein [Pseudoalteromonas sp. 1_MG-2023]